MAKEEFAGWEIFQNYENGEVTVFLIPRGKQIKMIGYDEWQRRCKEAGKLVPSYDEIEENSNDTDG